MLKRGERRKLELAVNSALIFGAMGLFAWAVLWPMDMPSPGAVSGPLTAANNSSATTNDLDAVDDQQWSERLASRRLQGWAVAPQAAAVSSAPTITASPAPASGPLAGVQLTGTIIEPGKSFAMVIDRHGVVDLKPVGGTLQLEPAGIRIDSIASRSIVVSYQGKTQELVVVKEPVSLNSVPGVTSGTTGMGQKGVMSMGDANATELESPGLEASSPLEDELDGLNYSPAGEMSDSAAPGVDN